MPAPATVYFYSGLWGVPPLGTLVIYLQPSANKMGKFYAALLYSPSSSGNMTIRYNGILGSVAYKNIRGPGVGIGTVAWTDMTNDAAEQKSYIMDNSNYITLRLYNGSSSAWIDFTVEYLWVEV